MAPSTIYSTLCREFGERAVQDWTQDRSGEIYVMVEYRYRQLRNEVRDYYESAGVDWSVAPTV